MGSRDCFAKVRAAAAVVTALAGVVAFASASAGATSEPRFADAGPPPDYARADSWAIQEVSGKQDADVFYIHPTTFLSRAWNQRMGDAETRDWTRTSVAERQVSAFARCCRRFMPYYRQASSRAFVEWNGRGAAAYELAYGDVLKAFRDWAAHKKGRPFILAGHSQGALLGLWLLKREIAGTPLASRLVAAYLPGIGIPAGALPQDVPECRAPSQTRCVASWNSFTMQAGTIAWAQRSIADYAVPGRDPSLVCVNPLTFDAARPDASARTGKGMLPVAIKGGSLLPMVRHPADAHCQNGILRVTPRLGVTVTPLANGSLHMHDIALFWGDISANAALRVRSWRKEHP